MPDEGEHSPPAFISAGAKKMKLIIMAAPGRSPREVNYGALLLTGLSNPRVQYNSSASGEERGGHLVDCLNTNAASGENEKNYEMEKIWKKNATGQEISTDYNTWCNTVGRPIIGSVIIIHSLTLSFTHSLAH